MADYSINANRNIWAGKELPAKFEGTLIMKRYSALTRQIGKQNQPVKLQRVQ